MKILPLPSPTGFAGILLQPSRSAHSCSLQLAIATTASTLAPLIYRASPIDPILQPPSSSPQLHQSASNKSAVSSSPDHTSTTATTSAPPSSNNSNHNLALPRLATLASLASTSSPQLRYVLPYIGFVALTWAALPKRVRTRPGLTLGALSGQEC